MSFAYDKRKGKLRKEAGKGKRNGYWQLKVETFKTLKGKLKTGYRVSWFGIV